MEGGKLLGSADNESSSESSRPPSPLAASYRSYLSANRLPMPCSRLFDTLLWLLVVANAEDCLAVLCCRGKAVEMSTDHKPICSKEKKRIEAYGGSICDGYLNGQLNVTRALGDWHMEGMKSADGGPLSEELEVMTKELTEEDEFIIIGCDGIWDVFRSQNAMDFSWRRLQEHNDPVMCNKDLVEEALKRRLG